MIGLHHAGPAGTSACLQQDVGPKSTAPAIASRYTLANMLAVVIESIPPAIKAGTAAYKLAKRQGWIDQFLQRLKHTENVLLVGTTGVGKSQFIDSLSTDLPVFISEFTRTADVTTQVLKYDGDFFRFIDTPGEVRLRARRVAAYNRMLSAKEPGGIINVVCNGYHEYAAGRSLNPLTMDGQASEEYLQQHRETEIASLADWVPVLLHPPVVSWMVTVVTKADLWWAQREEVVAHYTSGAYREALGPVDWLAPTVVTYSSLRHKFYGTAPTDGYFDDADLSLSRQRLLTHLVQLSSSRNG